MPIRFLMLGSLFIICDLVLFCYLIFVIWCFFARPTER